MTRWLSVLAVALAATTTAGKGTVSQPAGSDPADVFTRRIIKTFDFNEKPLGNLEEIPMDWDKVTLSGFPHYVNGRFDYQVGCPSPSFRMRLNGGNLGYAYTERLIPAFPGSDHKIVAMVKTANLRHARGYFKAFYIDRFGNILLDTLAFSELIGSVPSDPAGWQTVTIELPFTNPDGRFIGLGVFLVQQDQLPSVYASPLKSYRKDIDATMWVDQITVIRLPKVRLNLPGQTTLYHSRDRIGVDVMVADAKTGDLTARVLLHDFAAGKVTTLPHRVALLPPLETILSGQAAEPQPAIHRFGPLLPGLYGVTLQALSNDQVIIENKVQFAVLSAKRPPTESNDFGLDLSTAEISQPHHVAAFVEALKPTWTILPLWRKDLPVAKTSSVPSPADKMVLELNHRGINVLGAFLDVPEDMIERTNILSPSIWDLLAGKPQWWRAELSIILSRHADRIDQWIFGKPVDCWQSPDPRMKSVLAGLRKEFTQFQGQFKLIPAWPAMMSGLDNASSAFDGLMLDVPSELIPGSFDDFFKPWQSLTDSARVIFPGQDLEAFHLEPALVDFVNRFLQGKRNNVQFLAARDLWTTQSAIAPGGFEPNAYFVPYANLIDRLGGLDYLGKIQIAPERYGEVYCAPDRAVMILRSPKAEDYRGEVFLGDQLTACDLWGRPVPIRDQPDGWQIAYRPIVFVDGIDAELVRFIAGLRFDPPLIGGKFGAQQVKLLFKNTFSQSISGTVRLQGPHRWQFDPSGARFVLTMGKDFSQTIKLRYPSSESLGEKTMNLRFEIEARKPLRLNLFLPLRLGSSDLDMRVLWFLRKQELIVWQEVLNNGTTWADLVAFTIAPDKPRMERPIRRLGPGQTATKEYSLGPWRDMFGKTIRVGFREVRGTRLVNEVITLE